MRWCKGGCAAATGADPEARSLEPCPGAERRDKYHGEGPLYSGSPALILLKYAI